MNKSGLGVCACLLLASLACAPAQVTVEVTQEQSQFLVGEPLKAAVRITNLSGRDLRLGGEEGWLTLAIESREGIVVPKLGEAPVLGQFTLESSKVAIKRVDLAPYFLLSHPGNYQIVATVRIPGWNREVISTPKSFDVIGGVKIWESEVGVPSSAASTNAEPEIRRYILQQANYHRGQIRLYLRVTDAYGKPIRVFNVGTLVSFSKPEPQVDKFSNLHLLYQDGPSTFAYNVCNLDGELITRRYYEYIDSRPRLGADTDGNIVVVGGVRRITPMDLPIESQDAALPQPGAAPKAGNPAAKGQLSATKP